MITIGIILLLLLRVYYYRVVYINREDLTWDSFDIVLLGIPLVGEVYFLISAIFDNVFNNTSITSAFSFLSIFIPKICFLGLHKYRGINLHAEIDSICEKCGKIRLNKITRKMIKKEKNRFSKKALKKKKRDEIVSSSLKQYELLKKSERELEEELNM